MANEQNLVLFTSEQSREEAKKNGAKGGVESGKVRRKRKAMQKQMEMLLSLPFNLVDKNGNQLKETIKGLGIDEKDIDNQMAMIVALWRTALGQGKNQVSAIQEIRDIVGEKSEGKESNVERVQIINDLPGENIDETDKIK